MRAYDVEVYESREDWLPQRGLGGSDAATIAGLNQYKPPLTLWAELTGKLSGEIENQIPLKTGERLESLVLELLDGEIDYSTWRPGARRGQIVQLRSKERPWQTYTPDAVVLSGTRPAWHQVVAPVEAKTTAVDKSWDHKGSAGPVRAEVQLHHGFSVLGTDGTAYMAALLGNRAFTWFGVTFDQDIVDWLVEIEETFLDLVKADIPPDHQFSEEGAKVLAKLLPYAKATVAELGGAAAAAAASELKTVIEQRKHYEKREKELRQQVMHAALEAAGLDGELDEDRKLRIETPSGNWSWSSSLRSGYEVKAGRVTTLRPLTK